MGSLAGANELLSLIDIFRLTVQPGEVTKLEQSLRQDVVASDDGRPSDRPTRPVQISCLDLSSLLAEKKVIGTEEQNPWSKLQQILFERLMIEDYGPCKNITLTVPKRDGILPSPNLDPHSLGNSFNPNDSQILRYLYGCYCRIQELLKSLQTNDILKADSSKTIATLNAAENLVLDQVILYLTEPDLFPDRDKRSKNNQPAPLLLNLVGRYISEGDLSHKETISKFVCAIGEMCKPLGDTGYDAIVDPTYARLSQKFVNMAIDDPALGEWFDVTMIFLQQPDIAKRFLEKNTIKKDNSYTYQSTLFGFMISISHLPRSSSNKATFFNNPTRSGERDHKFTETQIGIKLQLLCKGLHTIFHTLLKFPQTRSLFLSWMGRCLHTFKDRKKLWSNQVLMTTTTLSVNDGFLMNFLTTMLHLSEPFAGPYELSIARAGSHYIDKKLLKVDPRYCKWSRATHDGSAAHFLGFAEETFLVNTNKPKEETSNIEDSQQVHPNFITECFFGTHQAFNYGFRSVYERFFKLAQNIQELNQAYMDALAHPLPSSMSASDPREMIKERIDASMGQFFNLKAILMVPNRITMQLHFCIATAAYLNHLVACQSYEEAINSKEFKTITIAALKEKKLSRECLEFMPEMLIENVLDFFVFLKNFNDQAITQAAGLLEPLMTMIIVFMGNSSLMQNPHLRARFAEILESLMPHESPQGHSFNGCTELFESHPLVGELAPALVNVFVSIEMTGEGVQFEQKFSYRRPMYVVLEHLWDKPLHRGILIKSAEEAEANIDSARPPLFLRFINLLMNDAIFLLDEALGYMNQLKEAEKRRTTEEWRKLNPQQRAQAEAGYAHVGRLARFHNVLSLSTINTIAWLTTEIKTIFSHPTLVDRIANMLNYFLKHLVGPEQGKFNVSDKKEYEFEPQKILEKICRIYINLGQPDGNKKFREFCTAVSSDGRSYSEDLLPKAKDILFRKAVSVGIEFEKLSQLVHKVAVKNQMDEIPTDDLPDTFLDPIMSTLMVDPVLLPSSNIIVDRSTIARHLLSDQTDPFNRSPLSMEDIIPQTDLKNQIQTFLKEWRENQKQNRNMEA